MKKHKMVNMVCIMILFALSFSSGVKADRVTNFSASGEVVHIQTSLLVREEPSMSGDIIGSLKNGDSVGITGETDGWYRIRYGSGSGYVSRSYISAKSTNNRTVVDFQSDAYVKVVGTLNVRERASMSASVIGSLKNKESVRITGETADWYRIRYGSGTGYVSKFYITFSSLGNSSAENETGTVHVDTTLLVRKKPSASGTVIGYFTNGKEVTIQGESGDYYRIRYQSASAYVSKKYVTKGGKRSASGNDSSSFSVSDVSKKGYADVSSSLLVRRSASSSCAVIGRLRRGARISITGETTNWYQIDYFGKKGYVNKAYVAFGAVSSNGYENEYDKIRLNVPLYHQYDRRWASVHIGRETLKSAGCVTACLAMIQEYRTGVTCTPSQMAGKLSYTSSGNVYWPAATTQYTGSNYMAILYQQLAAGNPVIIGAKYANGSQHYVVVTGYNGDSSSLKASGFTVNDPGTGGSQTLQSFLAKVPRFYKLVYYM